MADNVTLNSGTGGATMSTDEIAAGIHVQRVKVQYGVDGSATDVSTSNPMPTNWAGTNPPIGAGTEAAALRVTVATDSTGVVAVTNTQLSNLHSADFDTGGGTDTTPAIGLAVPASGGAVVITGDASNGLDVDVTRVQGTVTISGTVTADAGTNLNTSALALEGGGNLATIAGAVRAEDAAHGSADTGVMALAVRKATPVDLSGTDGDYEPLQVSAGRLWVDASGTTLTVGSHAVTNAGTFAVQDSNAHTADFDTGGGTDTTAAFGIAVPASGGAAVVTGDTSNGLDVDVTRVQGTVTISGTVTADAGTNLNTSALALESGGNLATVAGAVHAEDAAAQDADAGVMVLAVRKATPANSSSTDGDYESLQMNAGRLWVDASGTTLTVGSHAVTNGGTFAVQADGSVAHDSADSGAPVKVGAKATTSVSGLTNVANGDRTDLYAGVDGVMIMRPHANLEDVVAERTTNTDGASTAFSSGLGAPGAGVRLNIMKVTIANSSASFCTVDLRDGSAGSVLYTVPVPATGGADITFPVPLRLTANTALAFDASAATTTLSISGIGFKSKV